ncbi:MAG TPA: cation-translocating P-type ATPase [Aggregatilineales bacterium]|nr:cation-translocating P-type ATPase [Aggregatilineales bacterium]
MAAESTTSIYHVEGMDCAHCAREVEASVERLTGVQSVAVDFVSGQMRLRGSVPYAELAARVALTGKRLVEPTAAAAPLVTPSGGVMGFWAYLRRKLDTQLALVGAALVIFTFGLTLAGLSSEISRWLYSAGMLITLYPIARNGLGTLWATRQFNINLLMTIAAFGALALGEYLESATVIFLFAIGEALEGYTADRARDSIRGLVALKPTVATRVLGILQETVPVDQLAVGERVLVRPGDQIPVDGQVVSGASSVNQAPITGESLPVSKMVGDDVFAGSINGEGALTVTVTRLAADNTLSRIISLVEQAASNRAHSQRMIDRFASIYTPAVTVVAALVAFLPPLLLNAPFYDTPTEHGWLYRAISMLVIACPCALVISTPVTVISAITAAARRGVLIKGGVHLEALGTIKVVAFDKTGTLTYGRPVLAQIHSADCTGAETCPACDDLLALANAVEAQTAHPLARAITQAAETRALSTAYPPAEAVELLPGRGVRGQVNHQQITLGSHRFFDESLPHSPELCHLAQAAEAHGQTTLLVAENDRVRGFLSLTDAVRPVSRQVVSELTTQGITTVMLTGDHAAAATHVASQVGVHDVRASLLPADKLAAIHSLRQQSGPVAMVGDGVNDTPALAAATVGIAMGAAGSPQALETADVALMADDLTQLPFALRLARFARHLIAQNVLLSFGVKAVFLVLAFFGLTSLWVAILADVGMSLLVTLNGMRPLRHAG